MPGSVFSHSYPRRIIRYFSKSTPSPIKVHASLPANFWKDLGQIGLRFHSMASSISFRALLFVTSGPNLRIDTARNKHGILHKIERSASEAPYCTLTPQCASLQPSTARPSSTTRPPSPTRCRETVKRKVALFVGYDGSSYRGFQRNAGVSTVSDALERALHSAKAISDENLGFLNKIKWQVAARTDSGVGAAGNLVSAKLLFNRDELSDGSAFSATTDRVNAHLPPHVRLFGIQRITSSFNARLSCEARWYEYMLPMSVLGNRPGALSDFNTIIKSFAGSHFFHNYTIGADHSIPPTTKARRYIIESSCAETPIVLTSKDDTFDDELERQYVRILMKGQSFMMHQIRKMISLAILTYLGHVPDDAIPRSFLPGTLLDVPPVPSHGLFLDCCRFGWYNERHGSALPEPLDMSLFDGDRERFKTSCLLPSISKRFQDDNLFEDYFSTVNLHPVRFE